MPEHAPDHHYFAQLPSHRIRRRGGRVHHRSATTSALVVLLLLTGCRPSLSQVQGLSDQLVVPTDWQLVTTSTHGPDCAVGESPCPGLTRYYFVPETPRDGFAKAEQLLTAHGFRFDREPSSRCGLPPGGPECSVQASRDRFRAAVQAYSSGHDFTDERLDNSTLAVVSISLWGN